MYTYHPAINPTFPETCYLLSDLQEPIRECEGDQGNTTCVTSLPNCEGSLCTFLQNEMMFPNGILVTGEGEKEIELLRLGACPATMAVAIGGGGGKGRDLCDVSIEWGRGSHKANRRKAG